MNLSAKSPVAEWVCIFIEDSTGNVGIGTYNPTQAPLHVESWHYNTYTSYGRYLATGYSGFTFGSDSLPVSIYSRQYVNSGQGYLVNSDERIKTRIGRSDASHDLQTLSQIEITDYTFKDRVAHGNRPQKKVIAQQVQKVYPRAVSKSKNVVPDILRKAPIRDGWVELATDLKVGERVRLIAEKQAGIHEVLEVRPDKFRTAFQPDSGNVIVYGRKVDVFLSVDYEAIAMAERLRHPGTPQEARGKKPPPVQG